MGWGGVGTGSRTGKAVSCLKVLCVVRGEKVTLSSKSRDVTGEELKETARVFVHSGLCHHAQPH